VKGPEPLNLDMVLYTLVVLTSSTFLGKNVIVIMSYSSSSYYAFFYLYLNYASKYLFLKSCPVQLFVIARIIDNRSDKTSIVSPLTKMTFASVSPLPSHFGELKYTEWLRSLHTSLLLGT
jgi:hypothetical protein